MKLLREDEVSPLPPSKMLLLAELRAWGEYAAFRLGRRALNDLPRGDGHPVMIVPGFGTHDGHTASLQKALNNLGYTAYGWGLERNLGMTRKVRDALGARLKEINDRHQAKVSLIGWSLGGVFVRELARHQPQLVRRVFTLGSPINGHPDANNVMGVFKFMNRKNPPKLDWDGFQKRRTAPPVPCCAIYSKSDGIVRWDCSLEEEAPNTENVEVTGSHFGLGFNPQVIRAIAERLAKPV